mmetsp:Transcript_27087/g.68327  ORF Transcript_27087/g.68327 Transcript_27087/m.68327 type:complete len:366 (+) Transcript_27087:676-1773(+)
MTPVVPKHMLVLRINLGHAIVDFRLLYVPAYVRFSCGRLHQEHAVEDGFLRSVDHDRVQLQLVVGVLARQLLVHHAVPQFLLHLGQPDRAESVRRGVRRFSQVEKVTLRVGVEVDLRLQVVQHVVVRVRHLGELQVVLLQQSVLPHVPELRVQTRHVRAVTHEVAVPEQAIVHLVVDLGVERRHLRMQHLAQVGGRDIHVLLGHLVLVEQLVCRDLLLRNTRTRRATYPRAAGSDAPTTARHRSAGASGITRAPAELDAQTSLTLSKFIRPPGIDRHYFRRVDERFQVVLASLDFLDLVVESVDRLRARWAAVEGFQDRPVIERRVTGISRKGQLRQTFAPERLRSMTAAHGGVAARGGTHHALF